MGISALYSTGDFTLLRLSLQPQGALSLMIPYIAPSFCGEFSPTESFHGGPAQSQICGLNNDTMLQKTKVRTLAPRLWEGGGRSVTFYCSQRSIQSQLPPSTQSQTLLTTVGEPLP